MKQRRLGARLLKGRVVSSNSVTPAEGKVIEALKAHL